MFNPDVPPPAIDDPTGLTLPTYNETEGVAVVVSLSGSDQLCITGLDGKHDVEAVESVLRTVWTRGIYRFKRASRPLTSDAVSGLTTLDCTYTLRGNPWSGTGEEAVESRALVAALFRVLLERGWRLYLATDVSSGPRDKDSWIFLRARPIVFADPSDVFVVSFNKADRIRLIGAPAGVAAIVAGAVPEYWRKGVEGVRDAKGGRAVEVKLGGHPWYARATGDVMTSNMMLAHLLARLRNHGFTVYAALDMSHNVEGRGECDSWVVVRGLPDGYRLGA
ncbi:hypothetical protein H9P43_002748 [Blastocladiella emersonii ATCC 22665]|nr:hypothetical protein H9P43_002748 [Blastocladiella emersonii ATCC 22665]